MNEWLVKNERERRALAALSHARLNFDPSRRREFTSANGWHLDQHRELLPAEPPGPPVSGGSWETACRLMRGYEFADPAIVRAFLQPRGAAGEAQHAVRQAAAKLTPRPATGTAQDEPARRIETGGDCE